MPKREQHWANGVAADWQAKTGKVILVLYSDDNHEMGFDADDLEQLISGWKEALALVALQRNRTRTSSR